MHITQMDSYNDDCSLNAAATGSPSSAALREVIGP